MTAIRDDRPEEASFVYMDAMRCIAASLVVLNHARDLILIDAAQGARFGLIAKIVYLFAGFGHQSVMIFFVLSGFWITGSIVRRQERPGFWREYLIDRLSRLLIVLVPVLAVGGFLDLIGATLIAPRIYTAEFGAHSMADVAPRLSLLALGGNLIFLQSLAVPTFGSNGPLWSLAFEFWYYIWFPALWLLFRQRRVTAGLGTLGLAVLYPHLAYGFASWLCGAVLYFVVAATAVRRRIGDRQIGVPIAIGGSLALLALLGYSRMNADAIWTDLAISAAFAVALLGLCLWTPPRFHLLEVVASYGAKASFSLYAIHYPLAAFAAALLLPGTRLQPICSSLLLLTTLCGTLLLLAWFASKATEQQTSRLRAYLHSK